MQSKLKRRNKFYKIWPKVNSDKTRRLVIFFSPKNFKGWAKIAKNHQNGHFLFCFLPIIGNTVSSKMCALPFLNVYWSDLSDAEKKSGARIRVGRYFEKKFF